MNNKILAILSWKMRFASGALSTVFRSRRSKKNNRDLVRQRYWINFALTFFFLFEYLPPLQAADTVPADLSAGYFSFKSIGESSDDIADEKFPCHVYPGTPKLLFDLFLKSKGEHLRQDTSVIQRICILMGYIPLGSGKYFVSYDGLGVIDLNRGTYDKSIWANDDNDEFAEVRKLSPNQFITQYKSIYLKQGYFESYYALIFDRDHHGDISVRFAALTETAARDIDKNNEPLCQSSDPVLDQRQIKAEITLSSEINISEKNSATFNYLIQSKNCKTNVTTNRTEIFWFDGKNIIDSHSHVVSQYLF